MNRSKLNYIKSVKAVSLIGLIGILMIITIFPWLPQPYTNFTEAEFFNLLNVKEYPQLANAKSAAADGDYDQAKSLLQVYFVNRPIDTNFNYYSRDQAAVNATADLIIQREFTHLNSTHTWPTYPNSPIITINGHEIPNTNWHNNPDEDSEWIWQLMRGEFMTNLAQAYETNHYYGNDTWAEYYANHFVDTMTQFIETEPPGSQFTWRTIDSANRVDNLLSCVELIKTSQAFTSEFCYIFLRFILDHGRYLADFHKTNFNWAFMEAQGIMQICMFLPEFTITKEWQEIAWTTFINAIDTDFYPDGGTQEQAMNYHGVALGRLADVLVKAKDYDYINVPNFVSERLEKAFVFSLQNTMPDNHTTVFGDTRWNNDFSVFMKGSELYPDNEELAFIDPATGYPVFQNAPPSLNYYFPDSGHFISRSAWNDSTNFDPNALFSFFDGGEYGHFYHWHNDFGSIQLYGFNRRFLLDPGIIDYTVDENTNYYRSSRAHNVVLLDGIEQNAIVPTFNSWAAGYLGSIASASHDQYGGPLERNVIFCNFRNETNDPDLSTTSTINDTNRYWIVTDAWYGGYSLFGNNEQTIETLWQLPFTDIIPISSDSVDLGSSPAEDYKLCIRTNFTSGNIGMYGFGPWSDLEVIQGGDSSTYGHPYGWRADSAEWGTQDIATTLLYNGNMNGPHTWFTVIYPTEGTPNISIYNLPFSIDGVSYPSTPQGNKLGNIFAVETNDGTDVHIDLMYRYPNVLGESISLTALGHQISFQGQQISLHFNRTNALTQILTKHTNKLIYDGTELINFQNSQLKISPQNQLSAITFGFPDDYAVNSMYIGNKHVPITMYEIENNAINLGTTILGSGF